MPLLLSQAHFSPPVRVTIGAGTILTSTANQSATTFTGGFTPTTGKALVRIFGRVAAINVTMTSVTIGGVTVTARSSNMGTASGNPFTWIGTVTGLTLGTAQDVVITGSNSIGKLVVVVNDLNGWAGVTGAANGALDTSGTAKTTIAAAITTTGGSLVVGIAGFLLNTLVVTLSGTGWVAGVGGSVGTVAGTSSSALEGSKVAAAATGTDTITGNTSSTTVQAAAGILELM